MKKLFFTVGPSEIYPTIPQHVEKGMEEQMMSISHRGEQFKTLFSETQSSLKKLLNIPQDYSIFFLTSATECWERILENCVEKKSYHLIDGAFSKKFYEAAQGFKKQTISEVFDGTQWSELSISKDTELAAFTQNETSNGLMIPMKYISQVHDTFPNTLIALDVVSSIPYVSVDYAKVDCTFFSLQKGFGMPAGLAVLVVSPRAMKKAAELEKKGVPLTTYRRFSVMKKYADKQQTYETPNVFYIYLFHKVLQNMLEKGIDTIRNETETKAKLLYSFIKKSNQFSLPEHSEEFSSQTVIVANVKKGSQTLIKQLKEKGFVVGTGYEAMKDTQIRIANFPAHSLQDVKKLIDLLKTYDATN